LIKKGVIVVTLAFYAILILAVRAVGADSVSGIASVLMLPGVWTVYSWAPVHDSWSFILMNIVNILFYYFLFLSVYVVVLRLKSADEGRPIG
jgi:hypothetical protein